MEFFISKIDFIVLGGGCFWGMQHFFDKESFVISTVVGYAGTDNIEVGYELVKTGTTGYAEVIKVVFDNKLATLRDVLALFFKIHDPTTLNRQGNDVGTQYRSVVFCNNQQQLDITKKAIQDANNSGLWGDKILTEVISKYKFIKAEEYHQNYLDKNSGGYICHFPRKNWVLSE